ncbi:MAG: hypothetical protein R3244_12430 [Thermoanaerobaculia bacterium]|nr:hypothetical protein [Thermoanaerobaculia bacterium]
MLLSVIVLLAWMTPSLGALSLGLHLSDGHHTDSDRVERDGEVADLLRAAAHGHHHDLAAAEHQHQARVERSLRSEQTTSPSPLEPSAATGGSLSRGIPCGEAPPRRGPPIASIASHSPLLL